MKETFYPPKFRVDDFHCPNCGVYSQQLWKNAQIWDNGTTNIEDTDFCFCRHCKKKSIWYNKIMIVPNIGGVQLPNRDLPQDVLTDYYEARDILNSSPRGAAALLRLAIQKLCRYLGEKGKNINDDISELVKKGLPIKIQQALDYVRVIGNSAVHPGQIDLTDDNETARNLFDLINIIADVMITQPKHIDELYNTLPSNQIEAINKRDNKNADL